MITQAIKTSLILALVALGFGSAAVVSAVVDVQPAVACCGGDAPGGR